MSKKSYIEDIDEFLDKIRIISYEKFLEVNESMQDEFSKKFNENKTNDVNLILSKKEVESIVLPLIKKKNDKYSVTEKILRKMIEDLNSRMVSNTINKLVIDGVFEVAFDDEINDFIFWIKE